MSKKQNKIQYDDNWEWPPAEKAVKVEVGSSNYKKKKEPAKDLNPADLGKMINKLKLREIEQDKLIYNLELKVNKLMEKNNIE